MTAAVIATGEPERTRARRSTTLRALRDQAAEMSNIKLYVCAATVELGQVEPSMEKLDGVMSTPRFLREVAGECVLFV